MSGRVRSRSRGRGDGQESSNTVEPVVAPKLGGKKSQQKEPPTGNVDIEPGQEKEGGTSVVQGASQEMGLEKTGGEHGNDPDVKGKIPPNLVPAKIPEAGDGQS
ncbi:P antigen family member 4 isoform X1 [Delphinus delphis]|uniref:P antigen family member 4 isoform X1 n=1 Tax=Delphinus delphis TaxID=9728 RepID=UPI0028C3FC1E|nr:P antigen family member 4 isoform X1 [Delphinus delphis]